MSSPTEALANPSAEFNSGHATQPDDLVNRVVQGAHEAVDTLAGKAVPAVERLKTGVSEASEALHARADRMSELRDEWAETMRSSVRESPLAAVAVALAVGALVSRLTLR